MFTLGSKKLKVVTSRFVLSLCLVATELVAYAAPPISGEVRGRAVYIDDGDTVVLLTTSRQQLKVRLSSIDAPEASHTNHQSGRVGQPYAANSREFLQHLIKGKDVQAHCVDIDRYGRSVCEIFVDGVSANAEMVRAGWAWANQASKGRYLRDRTLPGLQAAAQAAHLGLWAGRHAVPPWEWRKLCWEQGDCPN